MSRLRVLYHFAGRQADTGSPRALMNHIDLLDRDRIEPWFLATGEGPLADALRSRGVHVVIGQPASITYRRPLTTVRRLRDMIRNLREWRVDLVHLNELGWNSELVIGAWLCRIPVVLHVHLKASIAPQNLHRFMASAVILVSEEQRRTIDRFDRIRDKAQVIYNPIPLEALAAGRQQRSSLGLAASDFVIGTVAQLREGKGIDLLLETARLLIPRYPNLVFVIIGRAGEGQEEFAARMLEESQEPAFEGRARFLGSRADIPDLLASVDAFFLPTRIETLSVAVVEAMAAGLPVITTRVGGMTELLPSPEIGIIVDPPTAGEFAQAIAKWVDDPQAARAVGARGQLSLSGRFDPPTIRRQLEELYQRVTHRPQ